MDASVALVALAALATFLAHMATAGGYGYQRDELYFIACARHLAWGYVDQPPLIALVARVELWTLGDSLYAIRFLPAVAAAATVALTGRLARRFGGGIWAQALAMLALALAPFYLAVGNLLTMNAFEPLLWMSAAYFMLRALEEDRPKFWAALGLAAGLGFLNKYSMFFFMASLTLGVLATSARAALLRPGFGLSVLIAFALAAPNLAWQAAHGWPQLEVLRNAAAEKNVVVDPLTFYGRQILMMNPLTAPLWLAGLWSLLVSREGARVRWFGWAYLILSVTYLALGAKVYYLAPAYPVLLAAGAVVVERALGARRALRLAYPVVLALAGLSIAPQAFPLLPLPAFLAYQRVFDVRAIKMERHPEGRVPQNLADMLGWDTLVATLARVYDALPAGERRGAAIFTGDYGQAAAVDFLGPRYRLPQALSGHNTYYLLGPRGFSGRVVIAVGVDPVLLRSEFRRVERAGTFHDDYVLPDQNDLPIYKCTGPIRDFAAWWPHTKRYI